MYRKRFSLLALLVAVVALTGCFGTRVDETELCTETRYGNVTTPVMSKGWAWQLVADAECFPATQQVYPGGRDSTGQPRGEEVTALTRDSVNLTVEFAFEHQISPAMYFDSVFKQKRNMDNFMIAVGNAAREGARTAIGNSHSGTAFQYREAFGDSVQNAIQRSVGGLTKIGRVYIRQMELPPAVAQARQKVFEQNLAFDQAMKQRRIDSTANVTRVQNAEADFKVADAQARVYKENGVLVDLEVKKAQAAAMGAICGNAQTCIIGGSVMDTWKGGVVR